MVDPGRVSKPVFTGDLGPQIAPCAWSIGHTPKLTTRASEQKPPGSQAASATVASSDVKFVGIENEGGVPGILPPVKTPLSLDVGKQGADHSGQMLALEHGLSAWKIQAVGELAYDGEVGRRRLVAKKKGLVREQPGEHVELTLKIAGCCLGPAAAFSNEHVEDHRQHA